MRIRAAGLLFCALAMPFSARWATAQSDQTATAQLLGKAHALEVRGRMDLAKQSWQQVLLMDPNNAEALAGMARAAKLEGKPEESESYLSKLRAVNPSDPNIQRIQNMGTTADPNAQLQEAGRLAQAGQYAQSMSILRQMYGNNPPPGDAALGYYQTEAATEDGRPQAIAGLRALMDRYPQDSRYQIALGKILTYNPRTRAEGRKLLERHPNDPDAQEALRQSLLWDAQNPATAGEIRSYLQRHPDQQLAGVLKQEQATAAASRASRGPSAPPMTAEQRAAQQAVVARNAEQQAAYNALNAHRVADAEERFKAILAKNPQDWQALAGLGYVRMQQSNFGGAISYLEQAIQDGAKDPGVHKALDDSRFYFTMQSATAALNENDLVTAQSQFSSALKMKPNNPTALLGLGGTYLKAQQPDAALGVFAQYVKLEPGDRAAWRGLFMAEYGATKYNDALAVDRRVPPKVHAELMRDPDYLRTLASVYSALGRDADAQRVLRSALELPFPAGARGLKADVEMQYAALLAAAGHGDQAAGLYRQVLAGDSTNTAAWQGLVQTLHTAGRDGEAFQVVQSMPPANYNAAMQEAGFETTVAAVFESQGHDELAQSVLEKFLEKQRAEGKKPFVPAEVELAGIYMRRGNSAAAYPIYREMLSASPDNADAWKGLLSALHSTGHDAEAQAQLQQIPPAVRVKLERDPAYLQVVGSIYAGLGQPQEAMQFMGRVEQHYSAEHVAAPADVDIQGAWLLYNAHDDAGLYRTLMTLGTRNDLTDQQRLTVQTIWANWAVRRANAASARGDYRRAIAILNAAAKAFPGNPGVIRALASGYASAGMPKEAVAIFRSQDLSQANADDYKAAIGAALAANDLKDAEVWLRFGLEQYPRDPQMLQLAAKFEQARGDPNRAAEYYRAALKVMPAPDPGMELAGELHQPMPKMQAPLPQARQPADLATLLGQPDASSGVSGAGMAPPVQRPYLPSYNGSSDMAPVQLNNGVPSSYVPLGPAGPASGSPVGSGPMGAPSTGGYPEPGPAMPPQQQVHPLKLKDYVPQSRVELPGAAQSQEQHAMLVLHPDPARAANYRSFIPGEGFVENAAVVASAGMTDAVLMGGDDTPRVEFLPNSGGEVRARIAEARFVPQQGTIEDGTPIVPYAPVARPVERKTRRRPHPTDKVQPVQQVPPAPVQDDQTAEQRAAAIRANQAAGSTPLTGVSHPPADNYDSPVQQPGANPNAAPSAQLSPVQFSAAPYNAAQQGGQVPSTQAPAPGGVGSDRYTGGQQYPQPNTTGPTTGTYTGQSYPAAPRTTSRRRSRPTVVAGQSSSAESTTQEQPSQQPMQYPQYAPALTNQGYPQFGGGQQAGQAPSDYDLQRQNLPPLRGYFDPRIDPNAPLTPRQQTELDLATIEGSYSPWVGGSVIGRYRSGTAGIDRLTAFKAPFEASTTIGNSLRLTGIVMPVFLNSGQLDTQGGSLTPYVPLLGSLYGSATNNPAQQFASGVGAEGQIAFGSFAAAAGTTPLNFLVTNIIGRARWRPNNGHFTLYGGRDAVEETQLSYAGMRDPASATTTYGGNVWGGVVQTGGGVRFDIGNERAGMYIQGEGADLTGYHVLENRKFDGTMGAYFRVKTWPEYGSLNIGGLFFGMHYDHNERAETYGLGGYFSPETYFLAAVPVTFSGHSGVNLHYAINGSVGVQTFQEDNGIYFPLDTALQNNAYSICVNSTGSTVPIINRSCGQQPLNSNTGLNFSFDSELSYHVNDHWYVGGFVSANNTNNYDTVQGGFFMRYMFRPQYPTVDYPTGLFPVEGLRPLRVP